LDAIGSAEVSMDNLFENAKGEAADSWNSFSASFSSATKSISDVLPEAGAAGTPSDAATVLNQLKTTENPPGDVVDAAGIDVPDVTETATQVSPTSDQIAITGDGQPATDFADFDPTQDGTLSAVTLRTEDPAAGTSEVTQFDTDGSQISSYFSEPGGAGDL